MSDAAEKTDCTLNAFISYSRHDAAIADTLVDALTALGFKVSIDRRSLPFGEKWQAELTDLIRLADTVVWLVSEFSVQSTWVNWELDEVARWSKRLVPIMVGETPRDRLPRQLGEIHILPAQGVFEIDRDLSLLQRVLESDHEWLKEYTRLADRAFEWSAKGSALLLRGNALRLAERWRDQRPVKAPAPSRDVLDLILASRRASNQRQRWWTAGSLLVTAAATALAAFAYWQSQIAQANERRAIEQGNLAVRRYNAAKQAADSMTMNLARDLRAKESIPQQTVEVLLKAADEVMTRLISDSANDPELRLSHATMLEQYGEVFWLRGDATAAKDYSERCLDDIRIVEQGVERPAERVDITVTRHQCLYSLGDALRNLGRLEASEAAYREAANRLDDFLRTQGSPSSELYLSAARVHARIGDLLRTQGRFSEAGVEYAAAFNANIELVKLKPDNEQALQQISWRHNQIGDNLLEISNHEGLITVLKDRTPRFVGPLLQSALEHYQAALELRRKLSREQPRNPERKRDLVWSLALTGFAQTSVDLNGGEALLHEGIAEARNLIDNDKENTERLRYQALLHNLLGDVLIRRHQDEAAFTEYADGLAIRISLANSNRAARWKRDLFYTYARLVDLCQMFDRYPACESALDKALGLTEQLREEYRSDNVLVRTIARLEGMRTAQGGR